MFNATQLNQLFRFAFSLTLTEASAYDLLQSALEKYLRLNGSDAVEDAQLRYLKTMIRHQFIDQYRKAQRHPHQDLGTVEGLISIDMPDPEAVLIESEQIVAILAALSAPERELLTLWALEEYTAKEIAEQLQCPRGTVLSRIHRLRKKIGELEMAKVSEGSY